MTILDDLKRALNTRKTAEMVDRVRRLLGEQTGVTNLDRDWVEKFILQYQKNRVRDLTDVLSSIAEGTHLNYFDQGKKHNELGSSSPIVNGDNTRDERQVGAGVGEQTEFNLFKGFRRKVGLRTKSALREIYYSLARDLPMDKDFLPKKPFVRVNLTKTKEFSKEGNGLAIHTAEFNLQDRGLIRGMPAVCWTCLACKIAGDSIMEGKITTLEGLNKVMTAPCKERR